VVGWRRGRAGRGYRAMAEEKTKNVLVCVN